MKKKNSDLYRKEIIDPGDRASKLAHHICLSSYKNSPAAIIVPRQAGNFRGAVDFVWNKQILYKMLNGEIRETVQNDGAGGKPQFFTLVRTREVFHNLGWEIITMCADDIARSGGLPVIMVNEVQTKRITNENFHLFEAMMKGYGKALQESKLINITGEIAVMKHSITAFCDAYPHDAKQLILTWGGTCIGLSLASFHEEKIIKPESIKPGMPIVGLHEKGYRCNGGTFFTNLILRKYGQYAGDKTLWPDECVQFTEKLCAPSKSYAKFITRMIGWNRDGTLGGAVANILGIAHITGGGVWGKFKEILPEGIGADLHNMPKPPGVLLEAQEISQDFPDLKLSDWQAYSTFHGGCGMLIVCESDSDADILELASRAEGIEMSFVGRTIRSKKGEIRIASQFLKGTQLSSLKPF